VISRLHFDVREEAQDQGVRIPRALDIIKSDLTGMARVAEESHLLLTDIMARLGDNVATTLERVVDRLNKLEEQSDNRSDRMRSLEL